jgi:trans-aconitate 2-methyltransferase
MAAEVLSLLELGGDERVLDIGCGNGKITSELAARVPGGSVVGIDPSADMIAFAASHHAPEGKSNLRFEVGDARSLSFSAEFDLVVSFNALHWVPQQELALRSIRSAMKPHGRAQLRLVPDGKRKSLETVIEETRRLQRWAANFGGFCDPYLHLTPEQYAALAECEGLKVERLRVADKAWDFGSRAAFFAFSMVTVIAWSQFMPESERPAFSSDVLDRYAAVSGDDKTFRFCQMDVAISLA